MKILTKLLLVVLMLIGGIVNSTIKVEARDHIELFVERMYQKAFKRNPDASGMNYWTTRLRNKTVSASEFVSGVLLSTEMYNRNLSEADFIEVCYNSLFDRNSDASGKAYWVKEAQSHKRGYIVKGFVEGHEFSNLCARYGMVRGNLNTDMNTYGTNIPNNRTVFNCTSKLEDFFKRNYQKVLGRNAEASGLNYWVNEVKNGRQSAGNAASIGFLHSKEFLGLDTNGNYKGGYKNNDEFIKILYRAYLGREAEGNGYNYWFTGLKNGTLTRDQIIAGFAMSNEFANIIKGFQDDTSCGVTSNTPTPACTIEKVLVKEAYDEQILVPEHDEQVVVKPEWYEQILVKEAWDETVLVKEAYDEQVLVREAYDERVRKSHYACRYGDFFSEDVMDVIWHIFDVHNGGSSHGVAYYYETIQHPAEYETVHHEAEYETVHHEAEYKTVHHEAEYETVHHEAEYKTVHHDAVYKTEKKCK